MKPPDRQFRTNETDDRYMADLIAKYGDADEAARRNWREKHQHQHQPQPQPQPQQSNRENTKPQVYHFESIFHIFLLDLLSRQFIMKNKNTFVVVFIH